MSVPPAAEFRCDCNVCARTAADPFLVTCPQCGNDGLLTCRITDAHGVNPRWTCARCTQPKLCSSNILCSADEHFESNCIYSRVCWQCEGFIGLAHAPRTVAVRPLLIAKQAVALRALTERSATPVSPLWT